LTKYSVTGKGHLLSLGIIKTICEETAEHNEDFFDIINEQVFTIKKITQFQGIKATIEKISPYLWIINAKNEKTLRFIRDVLLFSKFLSFKGKITPDLETVFLGFIKSIYDLVDSNDFSFSKRKFMTIKFHLLAHIEEVRKMVGLDNYLQFNEMLNERYLGILKSMIENQTNPFSKEMQAMNIAIQRLFMKNQIPTLDTLTAKISFSIPMLGHQKYCT